MRKHHQPSTSSGRCRTVINWDWCHNLPQPKVLHRCIHWEVVNDDQHPELLARPSSTDPRFKQNASWKAQWRPVQEQRQSGLRSMGPPRNVAWNHPTRTATYTLNNKGIRLLEQNPLGSQPHIYKVEVVNPQAPRCFGKQKRFHATKQLPPRASLLPARREFLLSLSTAWRNQGSKSRSSRW
jgi:hypothetical protein